MWVAINVEGQFDIEGSPTLQAVVSQHQLGGENSKQPLGEGHVELLHNILGADGREMGEQLALSETRVDGTQLEDGGIQLATLDNLEVVGGCRVDEVNCCVVVGHTHVEGNLVFLDNSSSFLNESTAGPI